MICKVLREIPSTQRTAQVLAIATVAIAALICRTDFVLSQLPPNDLFYSCAK